MSDSDPITRLNAALEGRYRIERQLGEGGMATVYLADDLRHERKVALKVLKPELAAVVGADRFLAEIKTTANLQHPHILPLFDSGEADSFLFYVMPFVEGESLRGRLDREHQLPVDEAVRIATAVANALDYAHRHSVIHRDIKPANILLHDGEPVVSDFGIALALGAAGAGRLTETGLSLGTPHYMSPEQATGDLSVGAATDIYALGCVLYEMLVGEPPYTGSTPQAVLGKIVTGDADPVTKHRRSVPGHVDAAIRKALEKVPADRFGRAQGVSDALSDAAFRYRNATSEPAHTPVGLRVWAVGATAIAVVLAITTVWSLAAPDTSQPVSRLTIDRTGVGNPSASVGSSIDISPDGSMLVFVGVSGGVPRLWLRPMDQLDVTELEGTNNARYPRFSPDGGSVAFIGDEGLTIASLTGGPTSIIVPDSMLWPIGGIEWGPAGLIYFINSDDRLARMSVSNDGGGPESVLPDAGGVYGNWPEVLPGAKGLLVSRRNTDRSGTREIVLVYLATGASTVLFRGEMARYASSGHIVYSTTDGVLYAAPFDSDRLEVTGPSQVVANGIPIGTSTGGSDFAVSETGVLFYRTADLGSRDTAPVWIGRDGSEESLDLGVSGRFTDPAISPDGRRVAFEYTAQDAPRDIWIFDLDQGSGGLRLTLDGPNNWQPFWNLDGTEVGFTSDRAGSPSIYEVPSDRSAPPTLLRRFNGLPLFDASFTPDANRLVYRQANSGPQVNVLYSPPHPDSVAEVLLDSPFEELAPSVSPGGQWLAYQSNESGQPEVYVSSFPERGGYTRISVDGGLTPVWAHNGREIVYRDPDGDWIIATVRTAPAVIVESRKVLHSGEGFLMEGSTAQFDIALDDQRILAIRRSGGEEDGAHFVVVQGLLSEPNRLEPTN